MLIDALFVDDRSNNGFPIPKSIEYYASVRQIIDEQCARLCYCLRRYRYKLSPAAGSIAIGDRGHMTGQEIVKRFWCDVLTFVSFGKFIPMWNLIISQNSFNIPLNYRSCFWVKLTTPSLNPLKSSFEFQCTLLNLICHILTIYSKKHSILKWLLNVPTWASNFLIDLFKLAFILA